MPRGRIPESKAFHLVDSDLLSEDCMFYLHLPLSGNTICMNT